MAAEEGYPDYEALAEILERMGIEPRAGEDKQDFLNRAVIAMLKAEMHGDVMLLRNFMDVN